MDGYREHPSDYDTSAAAETPPADDVTAAIGTDERRMHVRAYNYWVSLLDGRDFPSIEDLEPGEVKDFAPNSVLLDFTAGPDDPATSYIGTAIREECGLEEEIKAISEVPSRSLLSRLTDHYLQIIANRAPIGFEAEFVNQRGDNICYRGILMPFSSDGDTIDFIYGVINWKKVADSPAQNVIVPMLEPDEPQPEPEVSSVDELVLDTPTDAPVAEERDAELPMAEIEAEAPSDETVDAEVEVPMIAPQAEETPEFEVPMIEPEADQPATYEVAAIADEGSEAAADPVPAPIHFSWEDGPLADDSDPEAIPEVMLDEDAGLADRLWAAREIAEAVKSADGRTRAALYRALAMAYDFAVAANRVPEEYGELLAESGVKAQARAPMTPIVKLVFGIDYDKTRLTEFASALSYAQRQEVDFGGFQDFIEKQPGGLKALVAAERQARRPEPKPDTRGEIARARLREAAPLFLDDIAADEEFSVVVTRRRPDGGHEAVAIITDEAIVERAIRRAAA